MRALLLLAALACAACAVAPVTEPTGVVFGIKNVCINPKTGALYLLDQCGDFRP